MCGGQAADVAERKLTVSSDEASLTGEQGSIRTCPPVSTGQPELSPDFVPLLRRAPLSRRSDTESIPLLFNPPLRLPFQTT